MGLTDKHLAYGDDIPQTQIERDYYWKSKHLEEENGKLEQEQQSCEDCISRQAIKRKLQGHHDLIISAYGGQVGFKSMADAKDKARVDEIINCIAMIVNEPPVTPKKKTGKWILQPRCEGDEQPDLVCPDCGFKISWWDMGNFCAKCGKRLEGGAE